MLRVGVTGGIGSGKSTVSRRLAELGAVVVDADEVAREVVEPGESALRAIRERFGHKVIRADGRLDRTGLAGLVFPDPEALRTLEAITGPAIASRVALRRRGVEAGRVSVFDMPLLVERGLWVHEHLTIVVESDVETRVRRLVELRGLAEADARHRIAAQATDEQRRVAADVLLANKGTVDELAGEVTRLWDERLELWNRNLLAGSRTRRAEVDAVVAPRSDWAARGARVVAKLAAALAHEPVTDVSHIGSTAVPGLIAKDVIDVQVGVRSLSTADTDGFHDALRHAGYLVTAGNLGDRPKPGTDPLAWGKRFWGGCDPREIVHVHVRETDSEGWRFALLFRDWLRHESRERDDYADEKRRLLAVHPDTSAYAEAKEPWFDEAWARAHAWGDRTGWQP